MIGHDPAEPLYPNEKTLIVSMVEAGLTEDEVVYQIQRGRGGYPLKTSLSTNIRLGCKYILNNLEAMRMKRKVEPAIPGQEGADLVEFIDGRRVLRYGMANTRGRS